MLLERVRSSLRTSLRALGASLEALGDTLGLGEPLFLRLRVSDLPEKRLKTTKRTAERFPRAYKSRQKRQTNQTCLIFRCILMSPCVSLRASNPRRSHSRPRNEPRRGFQYRMRTFKSGEKRTRHVRVHLSLPFDVSVWESWGLQSHE